MRANDGSVAIPAEEIVARASCRTEFPRGQGYAAECEVRDANARLIAAAPDLLETLKAIKELAKPGQSLGISDAIDLICDIYNIALKALPTGGDD